MQLGFLTSHERRVLTAFAGTVLPAGPRLPAADGAVIERLERLAQDVGPPARRGLRGFAWALEAGGLLGGGRPFSAMGGEHRLRWLERLRASGVTRPILRAGLLAVRASYASNPTILQQLECGVDRPPARDEPGRWQEGLLDPWDLEPGEPVECEVVIVGTGAGGAALAEALAAAGVAVLMVEEGRYFSRSDFNGRPLEMLQTLYQGGGATYTVGNCLIPLPMGRTVGGSTTVNSGTCFRLPESTMKRWRDTHGLGWVTAETLDPYYADVEAMLQVEPAEMTYVGKPGEVIARGCEALGYSHFPLVRNAPGCDGQGICCFGCPTDAKRSTNVSYIPAALEQSAFVLTGVRVDRVLTRAGCAHGVSGVTRGPDGRTRRVDVHAQVVVLACGAVGTPSLLLRNELANRSREVGNNLSIHPAAHADALFDEVIDGHRTIPQGYCIDAFADEGLMFEGGTTPLEIPSTALDALGPELAEQLERTRHISNFGFMIRDTSRGRVFLDRQGRAHTWYWMNRKDRELCRRGMAILARVYFAAGAREVYPGVAGWPTLGSEAEVAALEVADIPARDFDLTAYHPLGTCRMGNDPARSVVGPTHETHDVRGLFICDGSSVPGAMGVNPQVTLMAMARRAAGFVHRRLEEIRS